MTRFFGGLSEWAINFLTGVGTNLYDWTDDSKKNRDIDRDERSKKIIFIVKYEEREISRYMATNANRHDTP